MKNKAYSVLSVTRRNYILYIYP